MAQFGHNRETLYEKYLFQSEISCMKTWHENKGGSKRLYVVVYNVNSVLHSVINVYSKARVLLKVVTVFRNENLALFMVISIYSIIKAQTGQKTMKSSW